MQVWGLITKYVGSDWINYIQILDTEQFKLY